MWKTLDELEKYLYMSQDETLRRIGESLVTLVEQEIETRLDDEINKAYNEGEFDGYAKGYEAGKKDALKRPVIG